MFVLLIVLQICLARLQALGWLEVSSTGLLIHFGPDYLKQVLMVDHKKGDQKCMMPHRVVGQKKNPVTSAPILLSKACHMAKHQIIASFTALRVTWQKEVQN